MGVRVLGILCSPFDPISVLRAGWFFNQLTRPEIFVCMLFQLKRRCFPATPSI
jgi:hypothetical protein